MVCCGIMKLDIGETVENDGGLEAGRCVVTGLIDAGSVGGNW